MNIIPFIQAHQLNVMILMSGICGILVLLTCVTGALSPQRRRILVLLEFSAMILLLSDRSAYIYRGDLTTTGYWMVRVCNFMVYFCTLFIPHILTHYLSDLYINEGKLEPLPRRLTVCKILFAVGLVLLLISQFTGLYYTFDAQNQYQRAPANFLCYAMPMLIILLQQTVVLQYRHRLSRRLIFSLLLNTVVPVIASIVQLFCYGISLTNMTVVGMAILLYIYALIDLNDSLKRAQESEIETYREANKREHSMFEQTAEALASAIDAKDPYTNGHSRRVAEYSLQIAKESGKSEEECTKIYFAALLHDVGKIGIPGTIINKRGRLTDEEFAQIKLHPVKGGQILSAIKQSPWLSIGARFHHERYDGRGYPEGLKGEDIPEIARIIAVADAYDAMTSNRSYRNAIPQQIVREEIVKGMKAQFDPEFAKAMLHMIDFDPEYRMQEKEPSEDLVPTTSLRCGSMYRDCTEGFPITRKPTWISLCSQPDDGLPEEESLPSLIVFDSLDGQVHPGEENNRNLLYFEYARIRLDGQVAEGGIRKAEVSVLDQEPDLEPVGFGEPERGQIYKIEAVHYRDHAMVKISNETRMIRVILALPDTSRFVYISVGGENCFVHNIRVETGETAIGPEAIPRIAEEISFIKGCPEGDIPNIQVDNWRTQATEGIPIADGMTLSFHSMSLPTARLVWHCPFISVFSSDDGRVEGKNFREYFLLRLDGENWGTDEHVENDVHVDRRPSFAGWNAWLEKNKQGLNCTVTIKREANRITMQTENLGIAVRSVTTVLDDVTEFYAAITGDQCAITDIHISRGK